jgi:hypothetical protein
VLRAWFDRDALKEAMVLGVDQTVGYPKSNPVA